MEMDFFNISIWYVEFLLCENPDKVFKDSEIDVDNVTPSNLELKVASNLVIPKSKVGSEIVLEEIIWGRIFLNIG